MDGRTVNGDAMGDGGYTMAPGASFATMSSGKGFHLSSASGVDGRSQRSGGRERMESGKAVRTSLGGDLTGLGRALLAERNLSYVHAAPPSLFTHVVQGCLASHFWGVVQYPRFLGSARDMWPHIFLLPNPNENLIKPNRLGHCSQYLTDKEHTPDPFVRYSQLPSSSLGRKCNLGCPKPYI